MKIKFVTTSVAVMMIFCGLGTLSFGSDEGNPEPAAVEFIEAFHTPRYPFGHHWSTWTGGDIINVYCYFDEPPTFVEIDYQFCNKEICPWPTEPVEGPYLMNAIGGGWFQYQLYGDWWLGSAPYYEATSFFGSYVKYRLIARDAGWGELDTYPGGFTTINLYPAWPPTQINASASTSSPSVFPGANFWVNGTTNYWNSTSKPIDLDPNRDTLIPVEESNVTVTLDGTPYPTKTDSEGNFSVQVTAPLGIGTYLINTTVTNSTPNRNVPCVASEITIDVVDTMYDIPITVPSDGWTFISFPVNAGGDIATVLDDSLFGDGQTTWDMAQWWDAQAQEWKSYSPFKPIQLNNMPNIYNTMGIWLHVTSSAGDNVITMGVPGIYSGSSVPIDLYSGWNLVGYPSATVRLASNTLPPEATIVALYDNGQPYNIRDETVLTTVIMREDDAYWVYVTADCIWLVDP